MPQIVPDVFVEAELICAVENLVTLRTDALFLFTFRDRIGRTIAETTSVVEIVGET